MANFFYYIKEKKIGTLSGVAILFLLSMSLAGFTLSQAKKTSSDIIIPSIPRKTFKKLPSGKSVYVPGPISMNDIKTKGCVADGFLSGYGDNTDEQADLINRSKCVYLHRALETWASAPDFGLAEEIMRKVKKPNVVYGMFLAEAINKKSTLFYSDENREFKFPKMCRAGSENAWGEHTCKPTFSSREYREYLDYITRRAIDTGIQSFLFGQIYFQESGDPENQYASEIVTRMRDYARSRDVQIIIGAQTGSITDPDYLKLFDYIEGGVGIDNEGNIEDGPCLSKRSGCWALLWHEKFAKNANNVLLHLDWSGIKSDDMSIFARMEKKEREETLKNLYKHFTSKNMGFMMPYLAVIHRENGGCYGPKKRFYSPDNKYDCKDEGAIDKILSKK